MHEAFPRSDYYETSAPPAALSRQRACPLNSGWMPGLEGRPRSAPRYCPGSIATATPQTFTMASPPAAGTGFGVDRHPDDGLDVDDVGGHALRPGPDPPGSSRCKTYGA
jgi:hypothetical protein